MKRGDRGSGKPTCGGTTELQKQKEEIEGNWGLGQDGLRWKPTAMTTLYVGMYRTDIEQKW